MVNPDFWRGKTVLVTGHTGFKGSWLSLWLAELGANVIGYALTPATTPNLFTLARVSERMTSIIGDINDGARLTAALETHQPDVVFHLAAQALVGYAYQQPWLTYQTNVMGTLHVLEAIRHAPSVRAVVNVTTDKCYDNPGIHEAHQETDKLGGSDPYSSSKACAELLTTAYRRSYFQTASQPVGLATARAGNVIGGGDWAAQRLVPDIMQSCLTQQPLVLRYPHAVRPWQHVLEPLAGYLRLAERLYAEPIAFSEAWNFGPDQADAKSVQWIVDQVAAVWGAPITTEIVAPTVPEAEKLQLNCQKAITRLQWTPRWCLQEALQATVVWYKAYHANQNLREVTLQQISEFNRTIQ